LIRLILISALLTLAACEDEGPAERTGERVDDAIERARDAADDAGDEAEERARALRERLDEDDER
jgi:hypothetical protein